VAGFEISGLKTQEGWMTLLPANAARLETLRQQLLDQQRELAAIVAQLEADHRLLPPLTTVGWQGPAQRAYELLVNGLRETLRAAAATLGDYG
jgi:hypothetical protein